MSQMERNKERYDRLARQFYYYFNRSDYNEALKWARLAGASGWHAHPGFYRDKEIEMSLHQIGSKLEDFSVDWPWSLPIGKPGGKRWLHVLTKAYSIGGHTRLAERIMRNSTELDSHSFILLDQHIAIPPWLIEAAQSTGGSALVLPLKMEPLVKAKILRNVANQWADIVVINSHPDDPIPSVAFGQSGGPPVLFLDHAPQVFWYGAGIADILVNGRTAERDVALNRRKVREVLPLPMPLKGKFKTKDKSLLKAQMGIGANTKVLLTIGESYKLFPYENHDFPKIVSNILSELENVVLFVIGPEEHEEHWVKANIDSNDKIRVMGRRNNIDDYYNITDIYLESFPFSSFTATLDAAIRGIPVLTAPKPLIPILALNQYEGMYENPETVPDYTRNFLEYIKDAEKLEKASRDQKRAVESIHSEENWISYIEKIVEKLPEIHSVGYSDYEDEGEDFAHTDMVWAEMQKNDGSMRFLENKIFEAMIESR